MSRKRPETTLYLGDQLYRQLEEYRRAQPGAPSASSIVREALRQYLAQAQHSASLSPQQWVQANAPLMRYLEGQGIRATDDQVRQALDEARDERDDAVISNAD